MDYPPILPTIEEELKQFLLFPENLPIHQYARNQQFWPREPNVKELLDYQGSPIYSGLKVKRDLNTGEIIEFREVLNDLAVEAQSTVFFNNKGSQMTSKLDTELLTVPPGFKRGLVFADDGFSLQNDCGKKQNTFGILPGINLLEILLKEPGTLELKEFERQENSAIPDQVDSSINESINETSEEAAVIPNDPLVLKISETPAPKAVTETEWAILLDTNQPVEDFEEQIPEMAMKYPFELDIFQKLAILQLEKKNNVFVAAHTSAGKTVVAEYAVALSKIHRTRSVYTSPIKALSNQKYRDFKIAFQDVGLITGDFQINKTASCLIMTTEILRSMLYSKSEITNDLEYVIFDEVHYINDRERGHVWEQVLIMLPPKVCVVLLSATVPNTMEFADWLGRTRQKKVYVVTTSKRPVPLKHYLYTGRGGRSKDNRFSILEVDRWVPGGYTKAKESLNVEQKHSYQRWGPQQDKTLWTALVDHLKKNDLLPVVAFTFSRQKCDNNAGSLRHLDLLSMTEKDHVKYFFNKCIRCLKEEDRGIPQVVKMREILCKGIGVHHSGILPIIKEIVEMLFQQGYIKLLFATETFAMGVNMPARTVVFDSVRKHDGKELRDLEPAEYIQMAGRAGRRGLDQEGTVLILCKQEVPPEENLKKTMLGKPSLLVSQFRLTYGMVLGLLKADNLSVESMMSNSFGEANHQRNLINVNKKLQFVEKQIRLIENEEIGDDPQSLFEFYEAANNYLKLRNDIMNSVVGTLKVQKILTSGRIILISHKHHVNKLAMILSLVKGKQVAYKVLVLSDPSLVNEKEKEDFWYYMMGLVHGTIDLPLDKQYHEIVQVLPMEIFEITSKTLHINTENIVRDVEKRQMERFKDAPTGQTCVEAVNELRKLTEFANAGDPQNVLGYLHYVTDIKVNEQDLYYKLKDMYDLKEKLLKTVSCAKMSNFVEIFGKVFKKKNLEDKRQHLLYLLSHESLSLYPDYENRIELLKRMEYVDSQNRPEFKGKVACVMGMNELMITELVVRNILTKLTAAEGAALLSALVFRNKVKEEMTEFENLPATLIKAIEDMKNIHDTIGSEERALEIQSDEFQDELNFGLVNVVYEWAINKPFADIMELTEIQEGIIVRCIQQLNETIMDVRDAAKYVGNPELQMKMDEASTAIKRDIVFAASLYTNE